MVKTTSIEQFRDDAMNGRCSRCTKPILPWKEENILEHIDDYGEDAQTFCESCIVECLMYAGWDIEMFEEHCPNLIALAQPLIVESNNAMVPLIQAIKEHRLLSS